MRILVTAAEQEELDCAIEAYNSLDDDAKNRVEAEFMLTGIGAASTCYRVTKQITTAAMGGDGYSFALNIGIAGSYDMEEFPIGSAALVYKDYFGDLGFETFSGFKTLFGYGILGEDEFPYTGGALERKVGGFEGLESALQRGKKGVGVTVQTVTGDPAKVREMYERFKPQIESMEGAAFYFVALQEGIPCAQIRTVSNEVGERDRSKWDIPAALNTLTECCKEFLKAM